MTTTSTAADIVPLTSRLRRGRTTSVAGLLIGPATVYVTVALLIPIVILLRYSLNHFVPGLLMVEALTPENYILFFTDPYLAGLPAIGNLECA